MKWKLVILALGILLLAGLLFPMEIYRLFNPATQQDVIQKVFGNQQNYDAFVSSQKVTAQLLHKGDNDRADFGKLNGYNCDMPVPLSQEQTQKIKSLLGEPSSYRWNIGNTCIPDYGVLFTFYSDQQTVHAALCFKCDMLGVFESEDDNAKRVNKEYMFSPMREELVAVTKSIFQNDATIQNLKEKRR